MSVTLPESDPRRRRQTAPALARPSAVLLLAAAILLLARGSVAQPSSAIVTAMWFPLTQSLPSADARLQALVTRAGVIFSGQVIAIQYSSQVGGPILVDFRVETPIKGLTSATFQAHFLQTGPASLPLQLNEKLVLFLHPLNAAGLTSFASGVCSIFERTGADRVDARRLRLCGAVIPTVASRFSRPAPPTPPLLAFDPAAPPVRAVPPNSDVGPPTIATEDMVRLLQQIVRDAKSRPDEIPLRAGREVADAH